MGTDITIPTVYAPGTARAIPITEPTAPVAVTGPETVITTLRAFAPATEEGTPFITLTAPLEVISSSFPSASLDPFESSPVRNCHLQKWQFRKNQKRRRFIMYTPKPINTDSIVLPNDLLALTEALAKNIHDIWAISRINEGWKYGKKRNDTLKTTPCLIPYESLSESEKEYDRCTALETLKMVIKLGYTIKKR